MAETHQNTAYKYTPSSANSTRQILDSTSTSTPSSETPTSGPSKLPFRPQASTRKSSNYAEADARARAGLAESSSNTSTNSTHAGRNDVRKGEENVVNSGGGAGGVGWIPRFGRTLSWNQQDMKRELQMSRVMSEGVKDLQGFSEVKK